MEKCFVLKNYLIRIYPNKTRIAFPDKSKYVWYLLPSLSVFSCMSQRFLFHSQPAVVINMHYLIYNLYIEIAHVTDPVELARIKGEDWLRVKRHTDSEL